MRSTLLTNLEPENIEWVWKDHIAKGMLTLLEADPGMGKTLLALDIAARITQAHSMPDELYQHQPATHPNTHTPTQTTPTTHDSPLTPRVPRGSIRNPQSPNLKIVIESHVD